MVATSESLEMTSWLGWWKLIIRVLANSIQQEDNVKFTAYSQLKHLSKACSTLWTNCILKRHNNALFQVYRELTLWTNCILKRQNNALSQVYRELSLKDCKELRNCPVYHSTELFPSPTFHQVQQRTWQSLQDAALCKACSASG